MWSLQKLLRTKVVLPPIQEDKNIVHIEATQTKIITYAVIVWWTTCRINMIKLQKEN